MRPIERLPKHGDNAVQCLRRGLFVMYHGDANIVRAWIAAVILVTCRIAARQDPDARLPPQLCGNDFAAAQGRDIEPEEEAAGRPPVAIAISNDLIRQIEFLAIEVAVGVDMELVPVGRNGDLLRRDRHLWCCDAAQFEEFRDETTIAHDKTYAQPGQI